MYLGEAVAKGGVNALLYRNGSVLPAMRIAGRALSFGDAIADDWEIAPDDWEIAPERFTLEYAIKEARKRGSAIMLRRAGEREVSLSTFAIASDEWEVC